MMILSSVVARPAASAEATSCHEIRGDWVYVSIDASTQAPLASKLTGHLLAELQPYQIAVCSTVVSASRPPLANVRIVHPNANTVEIEVWVEDAVTNKKLIRQLDLRSLPPDAHAMAIALGAAELLRASWAEIKLRNVPSRQRTVPESVRRTLAADEAPPTPPQLSLSVQVAGEEFSRGLRQGGVDARIVGRITDTFDLTLRAGAHRSLPVRSPDGQVWGDAWLAGFGTLIRVTPQSNFASLGIVGRVDFLRLQVLAEPNARATAASGSGTAAIAGAGVAGSLRVNTSAQLEVEVDAGGVLKGISVTDAHQHVMAMNGPWVGASFGLGVRLW